MNKDKKKQVEIEQDNYVNGIEVIPATFEKPQNIEADLLKQSEV